VLFPDKASSTLPSAASTLNGVQRIGLAQENNQLPIVTMVWLGYKRPRIKTPLFVTVAVVAARSSDRLSYPYDVLSEDNHRKANC
jgi:hypothetical protein